MFSVVLCFDWKTWRALRHYKTCTTTVHKRPYRETVSRLVARVAWRVISNNNMKSVIYFFKENSKNNLWTLLKNVFLFYVSIVRKAVTIRGYWIDSRCLFYRTSNEEDFTMKSNYFQLCSNVIKLKVY